MSAKNLVVLIYLQYILGALGALLLFVFVRQLNGVLLTFLFAVVLAYALNPVVKRLEGWWVPGTVAYLRGTLLFERWRKPPIVMVATEKAEPSPGSAVPAESPTSGEEASIWGFVGRTR